MELFLRIDLPVFFTGFLILVFVLPSIRVFKKTGINPFRFITKHDMVHDYVGQSMKLFILILFIVIFIYSLLPGVYDFLGPLHYMHNRYVTIVGLLLGHISLIGIKAAQFQMDTSWRIGIDYENRTRLITTGLYRFTRNPIYLFLLAGLAGLFMVLPNAVTFAVLFAAYLVLQVTIRAEESFLISDHGEAYMKYKSRVRRLL